jgi:AIG2-like family
MIYFAFGSNMDPAQMAARCPGHRTLGAAYLPGYDLCFPRRSPSRRCATAGLVATGSGLWGVLYQLEERHALALHAAEGYVPDGPAHENRHLLVEVEVRHGGPQGRALPAWLYRACPDGSSARPSAGYMRHLIQGAEHHGLPAAYVETLRSIETG